MIDIAVGDLRPDVLAQDEALPAFWRRQVLHLPGVAGSHAPLGDASLFDGWCVEPVKARVYRRYETIGAGVAKALRVERPEQALKLRQEAEDSGIEVTVLLNRVDHVSSEVRAIREGFGVGVEWRHDDVVATYSHAGSGIGYHIGHEDGFIVQLAGTRRWRIYAPEANAAEHHLTVLGDPEFAHLDPPQRPSTSPVADVLLEPGDAIHVPALHPHEGVTLEGPSLSLSIAWGGLNNFRLAAASGVKPAVDDAHRVQWFGLLPDLAAHQRPALVDALCELASGPDRETLEAARPRLLARLGLTADPAIA